MTKETKPDVVIMDVSMPGMNGIEATHQIKRDFPLTKIIALSMHSRKMFVTEMLKSGASGYLLKNIASRDVLIAIKAVMSGKKYLSPEITGCIIDDVVKPKEANVSSEGSPLTPREREILQLITEGMSSANIAEKLCVSQRTVESHRAHIMKKLDLHNVAELTRYAIREGITTIDT